MNGSPGSHLLPSSASSPKKNTVRKKATMDRKMGTSPSNADIMKAISDKAAQNRSFNETLKFISERMNVLSGLAEEVKVLKNRV